VAAELEEQAQSLRECGVAFQEAGLLGQAREAQEELTGVLRTLATLRGLAGTGERVHGEKEEESAYGRRLRRAQATDRPTVAEAPTSSSPPKEALEEEPLRWAYLNRSNALQLRFDVPAGVGSSDVEVEQQAGELFVRVPPSSRRTVTLPPRALADTLRVKLSRRQATVTVTVSLQTGGTTAVPALLCLSDDTGADSESDDTKDPSVDVLGQVVEGLTRHGVALGSTALLSSKSARHLCQQVRPILILRARRTYSEDLPFSSCCSD